MTRKDYSAYSMIVGRFQPFHNGHMDVVRKCASESEHLIVGIGSAQYSHHPENPFTAGERYMMLEGALEEELKPGLYPGQALLVIKNSSK